jgi:hypothetical protein
MVFCCDSNGFAIVTKNMISLWKILEYVPKQHGEHGVDATLHMLARNQSVLHEVFGNTPGGSWTQFDIIRPSSNEVYRWDHMPRIPEAKRPDWVLQHNEGNKLNFLVTESKQKIGDAYPDMGSLLLQFFNQTRGFLGIRRRPAWHRKEIQDNGDRIDNTWMFIPPEEDEATRYWFRDYDDNLLTYWTGFEFALDPEYYEEMQLVDKERVLGRIDELLRRRKDIQVAIAVGWAGKFHMPFVVRSYTNDFAKTGFSTALDKLLEPIMLE